MKIDDYLLWVVISICTDFTIYTTLIKMNIKLFIIAYILLLYYIFFFCIKYNKINIHYERSKLNCKLKCVIFSIALNYSWYKIKYFILSLKKVKYNGNLILIVEENSTLINNEFLKQLNISFIYVLNYYPYISYKNKFYTFNISEVKQRMIYYHKFKFTVYRHFIIKFWMDMYINLFYYYCIIDIRDVIFQNNPFDFRIKKGVYLFEEAINYPIKLQKKMVEWISVYENWESISNNPILNSGLTIGTREELYKFYELYIKLLNKSSTASQGTLNYYYYNGYFHSIPIFLFKNGYGLALHFHVEYVDKNNSERFFPPHNNIFVNKDKSIPSIIHQYDRIGFYKLSNYINFLTT